MRSSVPIAAFSATTNVASPTDGDSFTYSLNLRFPGQYFAAESGLHYNSFRDYDPATGRYIESDPANPRHLLTVRGVGYRFVAEPGVK